MYHPNRFDALDDPGREAPDTGCQVCGVTQCQMADGASLIGQGGFWLCPVHDREALEGERLDAFAPHSTPPRRTHLHFPSPAVLAA